MYFIYLQCSTRIFAILFVLIPDEDHRDVIIDHRPLATTIMGHLRDRNASNASGIFVESAV